MRGKKLKRAMKELLVKQLELEPTEWLYTKETDSYFIIINKASGEKRIIDKINGSIGYF